MKNRQNSNRILIKNSFSVFRRRLCLASRNIYFFFSSFHLNEKSQCRRHNIYKKFEIIWCVDDMTNKTEQKNVPSHEFMPHDKLYAPYFLSHFPMPRGKFRQFYLSFFGNIFVVSHFFTHRNTSKSMALVFTIRFIKLCIIYVGGICTDNQVKNEWQSSCLQVMSTIIV